MKKTVLSGILILGAALFLLLTESGEVTKNTPAPEAVPASLPAELFVKEPPVGAVSIAEARQSAVMGQTIVVRCRVGGVKEPFVSGRALAIICDMDVKSCESNEGCPSPWDMCCDASRGGKLATLQVSQPDGRVRAGGLEGINGINPLSVLVIEGQVGPRPGPDTLIIDARKIFVESNGRSRIR